MFIYIYIYIYIYMYVCIYITINTLYISVTKKVKFKKSYCLKANFHYLHNFFMANNKNC